LVVIAIIAIIATLILGVIIAGKNKARDAERIANLRTIGQALELYRVDTGHYPVALDWVSDCGQAGNNWIPDGINYTWNTQYLPVVPRDPSQNCIKVPAQSYDYWSDGNRYQLTTQLESPATPSTGSGLSFDGFSFVATDGSPLIATLSSSASNPTGDAPIPFTITFTNAVVDFTQSSLAVARGFVSAFVVVSDLVYNFFVTPTDNNVVTVTLSANTVHDATGGGNTAAQYSIQYDSLDPHLALSPAPLPPSQSQPFTVTLNSTIVLTDFSAGSVTVTNGTVSEAQEIAPLDGRNYSFLVTPSAPGTVTISMTADAVHSASGHGNVASNSLNTTYAP
jgi:type II secretory pathway pseudopilin PulG